MKIATWNVNSLRVRLPHLERWLGESSPDVACLQETKLTDPEFPADTLRAWGYEHVCFRGERAYNGVAIVSKLPLEDVRLGIDDDEPDPQARLVGARVGGIEVYGLYVPNGEAVGSPKFPYKLKWLERFRAMLARRHRPTDPVLVCGDMNIAPDDLDVWDPFRTEGKVLAHPEERRRLQDILSWGLVDVFRARNPFATEFSWWDYQKMGWERNHGLRIDHIFVTSPLLARTTDLRIRREMRGWDRPSDHVPVEITLQVAPS